MKPKILRKIIHHLGGAANSESRIKLDVPIEIINIEIGTSALIQSSMSIGDYTRDVIVVQDQIDDSKIGNSRRFIFGGRLGKASYDITELILKDVLVLNFYAGAASNFYVTIKYFERPELMTEQILRRIADIKQLSGDVLTPGSAFFRAGHVKQL